MPYCDKCLGNGHYDFHITGRDYGRATCPVCRGTGGGDYIKCVNCFGKGHLINLDGNKYTCSLCRGSGKLPESLDEKRK